jgi:hypothetical protein
LDWTTWTGHWVWGRILYKLTLKDRLSLYHMARYGRSGTFCTPYMCCLRGQIGYRIENFSVNARHGFKHACRKAYVLADSDETIEIS